MQSRRHGELKPRSPASKLRDDRADWRPEHYIRIDERSPPLRLRRSSLSPPKYERALRIVGREGRSGSVERREYGWELGAGLRTRVRSRSPLPVGHGRKRGHFDDAMFGRNGSPIEMREKYHLMEQQADLFDDAKHVYGYEHGNSRMVKERDYAGPILMEKSLILDGQIREVWRPPHDIIGPNSNYDEIGGNLGMPTKLDIDRFKEDSHRFGNNQLSMDKLPLVESLKEREKHMVYSRDIPYSTLPVSHSMDLGSTSHLKEFASTSSGIPRAEHIGPLRELRDGQHLPPDEYVNNFGKYAEPADYNGNEHKLHFNTSRDIDMERRVLTFQHQRALGPDMADHPDYLYQKHGQDIDDQGFPSDYSYRKLPSRARGDLAYGESIRQLDNIDDIDGPHMVMRRSLRNHPSSPKLINEDYIDVGRTSSTFKQVGGYSAFESGHAHLDRRFSWDDDIINSRVLHDQEISSARLDNKFARDGPGAQKDRLMKSSTSVYDAEKHRFILSQQRMRAKELSIYEPSERVLKRKYIMDEEISRDNSRSALSGRLNTSTRSGDLMDGDEEWIADDLSGLYTSRRAGFDHNQHRRGERTYGGADRYRDFVSDDCLSSRDLEHSQGRSSESYRSGARYFRGHFRQGYSSWHNPHQYDRRRDIYKQQRFWKNGRDDDYMDVNEDDVDTSEDFVNPADYEPPEDSEEFKQQLHKAFLKFTKKLNENLAVRRRYTEQGKAGPLFCIVCGRSVSKEFMDTQRLATHAYMSHKDGLKMQHLGLHKAICVLMGWNSSIDPDCVTWVPQPLSEVEALAQKEDIILWPPLVIIQNISLINTEPDAQKLVTKEELAEFLREKGFTGGKLKVSLGRPANHSFMVVKFMGTFTGLQDAEKLHKFFAESKHGRQDLAKATSGNGKADKGGAAAEKGSLANDQVLYGYMGIADDLDKLDFETKRRSLLKSKKEIQDLADAPVKT
ncbi:XS domain [Dillenia turbinata]|uniref:XS domain n=1 Tax=Dillenia turbinata TaxID=194707 RepID=A0AAN8VH70_9MAGN